MNTLPWERRLSDLAHIIESCGASYFDPERFRRNINQFLQTARTVTFIIQKNKVDIPGFHIWYEQNVINAWYHDELMQWAKDARNVVEKEGDLELNSELNATLIYSYLSDEDVELACGVSELLTAGVKKLVRFSQKSLPTSIGDAAAIKIERKWVTEKIPNYELLYAIGYVYSRIYDCCRGLAEHLDRAFPKHILPPSEIGVMAVSSRKVLMVKLSDLKTYSFVFESRHISRDDIPEEIKAMLNKSAYM